MKITEKHVNESHLDEIATLVQKEDSLIYLDKEEVKSILAGKEGTLYQANQEEGVENGTFMKEFLGALIEKEVVHDCTSMLMSIGMSPEDPLMMEDLEIIHNFFESINNENMEVRWGVNNNEEGERMSILTTCTKEKSYEPNTD